MIPYGRQEISESDIQAVVDVLRSEYLTQGQQIPSFENAVCEYVGARNSVAFNSATSALHVSCLSLGLSSGDIVWTSPNTFVASANAALYCGADVHFIDIDPQTYNISINSLKVELKTASLVGRLPKILIVVHFAGQSPDMEQIQQLSEIYGFRIIEDASHAIGGKYAGTPVGACKYSDITVFSFHPVKIITTGEGGMAVTNDESLLEKMKLYRSHGITHNKNLMSPRPSDEIWNYQQIDLGWNYRMTDLQAALGASQLKRIDTFVSRRHDIARRYSEALSEVPIILPYQDPHSHSSFHLYPVRIRKTMCGKGRNDVYESMVHSGIAVNIHYIPVYLQPYYERMGFIRGICPEAEHYFKETISLPIFPAMTEDQQGVVISSLISSLR